jgi:hypothetical protein
MLYGGNSLEWWETPLSVEGYKFFSITQGSWKNSAFVVPINCIREQSKAWERWECFINNPVWVRVIANEFYEVTIVPKLPAGPFRAPFFRVVDSSHAPIYEKWFRETGRRSVDPIREYFISSLENEVHFLAIEEPTFKRLAN